MRDPYVGVPTERWESARNPEAPHEHSRDPNSDQVVRGGRCPAAAARDNINGVTTEVASDPWQTRLDRMRRLLPLPLLAVSAAGALAEAAATDSWDHLGIGVTLLALTAALWTVATVHPGSVAGRLPLLFVAHTALAAALVWINLCFGVFAYVGFVYAYGLGRRWRLASFTATALIVSASLSGGYPSSDAGHLAIYLMVAVVLVALVLNSATITNRAVEQNQERGHMIAALADANSALQASMRENAELHAQLMAQARQAGVVEERQRLAGEIHDTLAQGLVGIITQLRAAEQTRARPEQSSRHLAVASSLARSSLNEARRSVRALRPEQLEEATLAEALGELVAGWSEQAMVTAELDVVNRPVPAGAEAEAAVFRIAQEALTNIGKHAAATKARVTLTYLADEVLLDVADNGVGFCAASQDSSADGYGLEGMRRRAERAGGRLTIESTPGTGTTINARVPVASSRSADA
jgi:signal transduction histidine kinase